jgi:hypothetical protein
MRFALTTAAAVALAAGLASAQIVANGDFETGVLAPWVFTADTNAEPLLIATVDTFLGSQMFRVNPGHDGSGGSAGGNLEQEVALQSGVNYTVSGNLYIENLRTASNANGGTITVSIGGQQLHTWTVNSILALAVESDQFSVPFSTAVGGTQTLSLRFTRTFRNSTPSIYHWADNIVIAGGPTPCYPNCDGSTIEPILNVADFSCFLGKFAAGDPYANCDGSTIEPVLNVADFSCFLGKFAAGCR